MKKFTSSRNCADEDKTDKKPATGKDTNTPSKEKLHNARDDTLKMLMGQLMINYRTVALNTVKAGSKMLEKSDHDHVTKSVANL